MVSVGMVSVGMVSVGMVSVGMVSVGMVSVGTISEWSWWLHLVTWDHLQMVIVAASGYSGPFANGHCGCIWPLGTICKWSLWLHPATRDHLQMVIVTASGHSGLFANGPCCLFCPGPFANGLFRCLSPPGTICKWSLSLSVTI